MMQTASRCKYIDECLGFGYIFLMIKTLAKKKDELSGKRSRTVRKTITLDGDLAQDIGSFVIESGSTEKMVINNLIRIGLIHEKERGEQRNKFSLPSFAKGIGDISRKELNALLDEV